MEGQVISKERSSTGRSFHDDGPTTEKALYCTVAKWVRGTKSSPLAAECSTRHAAKADTGQQRSCVGMWAGSGWDPAMAPIQFGYRLWPPPSNEKINVAY